MKLLFVSYPLLTVSEESAGGAEQVLWTLERELFSRGVDTWTAASNGSKVSGNLIETGPPATLPDWLEEREKEHFACVLQAVLEHRKEGKPFDLIHDMSGNFWRFGGDLRCPVVATLHLPRSFYPENAFENVAENVEFVGVTRTQMREFPEICGPFSLVYNGISERFFEQAPVLEKREYVLWLGRICEEKGPHHALDIAHESGERIIVTGAVYPFLYHQKFHAREVLPRLRRTKAGAKFISIPSFAEKLDLLRNAKALLITSTVEETSSLVAMEAAACGTPVIALRRGALPEVIHEGVTGFLADDFRAMRERLKQVEEIDAVECQRYAREHYSAAAMADGYERVYRGICNL